LNGGLDGGGRSCEKDLKKMKTEAINKWRFQLLLVVLLSLYAVVPFFERRLLTDLVSTAVLIFAISSVSEKRWLLLVFSVLAISAISAFWYAHWFPGHAISLAVYLLNLLFLILVVAAILNRVFSSRRIVRETIAGAICAYLLIGMMWANVYTIVENLEPGSFADNSIEADAASGPEPIRDQTNRFTYFSFVTLTTLGYGDITPVTRPAKNLAALEAIFGQLYLAVLIARLVSQQSLTDNGHGE
jgi:signal transduction histidine kinase